MKVLWISSAAIGPTSRILKLPYGGSSGSWIQTEYEALAKERSIQLVFMCPIRDLRNGIIIREESVEGTAYGIGYKALVPYGSNLPGTVSESVLRVVDDIKPDVIHIWGTESNFSAGCASLLHNYKTIIFIQGLIGMHQRYSDAHYVREKEYWGRVSLYQKFRSAIKRYYFKKHIFLEQRAIQSAENIITDNDFTRAYCKSFAPSTTFYNHFLAPADIFYDIEWDINRCKKNTIFTIFGIDKTKGLPQLLKALNIVRNTIPDVRLMIPGPFNIDSNGKLDRKRCLPFERWCANYIDRNRLTDNVVFLGKLDRERMASNYREASCFVSPSGMEVHSSSVREAMAVGMPVISSLCGSVAEYIVHGQNGLIYRFEEEEVLAYYIIRILSDRSFAQKIGRQAKLKMNELKSCDDMNKPLSEIYRSL